ncbi:hypothetical protein ACLOJK_034192, partial [Asimina triloba]
PVNDAPANDNTTSSSTTKTTFMPSRPRSRPPIVSATSSPSQIRQGCKPTSIIAATRGKLVSSVTDKPTPIPLRSSPISNLDATIF